MIDRNQPQLVDVVDLFHGLDKSQAQLAVDGGQRRAVDLDPLAGVGRVAPRGREPVADNRRADDIGDQLVLVTVPGEQNWARRAPAISLLHGDHRRVRQIDFVLQHARGPQNAQQINVVRIAQTHKNLRRPLRLIA